MEEYKEYRLPICIIDDTGAIIDGYHRFASIDLDAREEPVMVIRASIEGDSK